MTMCRFGNRKLTKFQSHNHHFLCQIVEKKNDNKIQGLRSEKKVCILGISGRMEGSKETTIYQVSSRNNTLKINVLFIFFSSQNKVVIIPIS